MPEFVEQSNLFRVGYALPARKLEAFMVESFIRYARKRGVDFIKIDASKPLNNQGPFDCIIHKLYDHEWNQNLENFAVNHPNITVIDPPSAVQRLHNRISMLEPISQLNIPKLKIPNQLIVQDCESLKSIEFKHELTYPVIAKSILATGSINSHKMSLVFNHEGLTKGLELDPPMVLQQFVNHGGTVFKVYVADDYVKCVTRSSLPDVSNETMQKMTSEHSSGVMSFSQISSAVIAGGDGWSSSSKTDENVKMPDPEFLGEVAEGLRGALGLHLFNFDMIRDYKRVDEYVVVDINYFPGYEKLPGYESVMTDFLLNIKKSQEEKKMRNKEVVEEAEV